jgi:hypothetical protein
MLDRELEELQSLGFRVAYASPEPKTFVLSGWISYSSEATRLYLQKSVKDSYDFS